MSTITHNPGHNHDADYDAAGTAAFYASFAVVDGDAAGGVLSGTYPNPGFASDMATQAELDAHTGDTTDAHDASAISYAGGTGMSATDVEAAIDELATEKSDTTHNHDTAYASKQPTTNTVAAAGAAETLDADDFDLHDITLDENVTFTFSTGSTVSEFSLILRQDGTGTNTVTWPASVDWAAATAPTLSTAAGNVSVLTFLSVDSGTTWLGFLAGEAMG